MDLDKLKEIRKQKGLSQMEVARQCQVSLNAYIRWENRCSNPTEENKAKLEKILS